MEKEEQRAPELASDDSALSDFVARVTREVFEKKEPDIDWQLVVTELAQMSVRLEQTRALSSERRNEFSVWIKLWERYARAGPLFQAEPHGKEMLMELERLNAEVFLLTETRLDWEKAWQQVTKVRSLIKRTRFKSSELRTLIARRCDELVAKLKSAKAVRMGETIMNSAAVSSRVSLTLSAAIAQSVLPAIAKLTPAQKSVTALFDSAIDQRQSSEMYKDFLLRQTRARKLLAHGSADLRLLWRGLSACRPLLQQPQRDAHFTRLTQFQEDFDAAWDLWLAGWAHVRSARLKSLKVVGETPTGRLEVKVDYLRTQIAYRGGRALELESKYEWADRDDARSQIARLLQENANVIKRLQQELTIQRRELKRLKNQAADQQIDQL